MPIGDPEGIRIQDLRFLHEFITAPPDGIGLLIHDLVISKLHIMSREFFPVMPADSLSQEEGDFRFRTFLDLPGLCQLANRVLEVPVIFDETIEDEAIDLARGGILGQDRIEKRGVSNRTDDQLIHLRGRPGADKDDVDSQENEKKDRADEKERLAVQ